ncbi:hypothetical protein EVAR_36367_1 [Eumeta japonica]|uniref:Uncharacterized protein n=1 Tax=Eumeta variegata TaxID=151549 RepID=A0A4C1W8C8_EUMVA|nr:hypothetical protein EVAR_36367_1 [Eumeta japonica]
MNESSVGASSATAAPPARCGAPREHNSNNSCRVSNSRKVNEIVEQTIANIFFTGVRSVEFSQQKSDNCFRTVAAQVFIGRVAGGGRGTPPRPRPRRPPLSSAFSFPITTSFGRDKRGWNAALKCALLIRPQDLSPHVGPALSGGANGRADGLTRDTPQMR